MSSNDHVRDNDKSTSKQSPPTTTSENVALPALQPVNAAGTIQLARLDPNRLSPEQINQLHNTVGNQKVGQILTQNQPGIAQNATTPLQREASNTSGQPLPSSLAGKLSNYGGVVQDTMIHRSSSQVKPGALATTEGNDIHLASNAPAIDSPGGELLVAHEMAHVVQQNGSGTIMRSATAEAEADEAAVAVLAGQPLPALGHADGPQHFEAQWHQATLTNAMEGLGFTDQEADTAYFSNWMRDVSQAFVPIAGDTIGVDATYSLLELISTWKFGRSFTPEQMGMYNPAEHIDNPAGQINADLIQFDLQVDEQGLPIYNPESGGQRTEAVTERGEFNTPFETLGSEDIASLFEVDESGLPAYMERSREYIKDEITGALVAGRTEDGLMHVGNFSHTIQDLFAHSNWVEMAVSRVIESGQVDLSDTPAAQQMEEREAQGLPPIENFAAEITDAEGNVRPMLMTGTFTTTDTIISIKEEVTNILAGIKPFDEGNDEKKWKFIHAVLEKMEDSIEEGTAGDIFTAHLDDIVDNLGNFLSDQAGNMAESGGQAASDFVGGGTFGNILQGGAELLGEGAQWAIGEGQELYHEDMSDKISDIVNELGPMVSLVDMAVYVKEGIGKLGKAWDDLKDWVSGLPNFIKEWLLPQLVAAEEAFKEAIKQIVTEAYEVGIRLIMDTVEGMSGSTDTAETNAQAQLEDLRTKMDQALGELASSSARDEVRERLFDMPIDELSGFIHSDQFRNLLAGLANAKQREELAETGERISQLANIPEWARAGASHSQIAKDHADSPFFGSAFTMAHAADNILVGLIRDAWGDMPAPGLGGDYGTVDPENPGEHDKFLENREMGQHTLEEGHPDEAEPARRLIDALDLALAIPGSHDYLGTYIQSAIDKLRENAWGNEALSEVNQVLDLLNTWKETVSEEGDVWLIGAIDNAIRWITREAHELTELGGELGADQPWQHNGHDHEHDEHDHHPGQVDEADQGRTEAYYNRQIDTLNQYRGQASNRIVQDEVNAEVERPHELGQPLNEDADQISDPEDRIYAEVDRIFAHPYDSNWWWDDLVSWANANKNVLAGYIMARNSGRTHNHHHGDH